MMEYANVISDSLEEIALRKNVLEIAVKMECVIMILENVYVTRDSLERLVREELVKMIAQIMVHV